MKWSHMPHEGQYNTDDKNSDGHNKDSNNLFA